MMLLIPYLNRFGIIISIYFALHEALWMEGTGGLLFFFFGEKGGYYYLMYIF